MKKAVLTVIVGVLLAGIISSCEKETTDEQAIELGIDNEELKEDDV